MFILVSVVLSRMGGRLCFPSGVAWFFRFWCLLFSRNVFLMWSVLYCFVLQIFHRMLILLPWSIFAFLLVYLGLCSLCMILLGFTVFLACMHVSCVLWNIFCMAVLFWNWWKLLLMSQNTVILVLFMLLYNVFNECVKKFKPVKEQLYQLKKNYKPVKKQLYQLGWNKKPLHQHNWSNLIYNWL